jgi:hypothetical protein
MHCPKGCAGTIVTGPDGELPARGILQQALGDGMTADLVSRRGMAMVTAVHGSS